MKPLETIGAFLSAWTGSVTARAERGPLVRLAGATRLVRITRDSPSWSVRAVISFAQRSSRQVPAGVSRVSRLSRTSRTPEFAIALRSLLAGFRVGRLSGGPPSTSAQ